MNTIELRKTADKIKDLINKVNSEEQREKLYDQLYEIEYNIDNLERALKREELRKQASETGTLTVSTMWEEYPDCKLSLNHYKADKSLCIDIWNLEEGPIARLTVCLNKKGLPENQSYIDDNNCPWALEFIETYGLGKRIGIGFSGYCTYSLVEWNIDELNKYI